MANSSLKAPAMQRDSTLIENEECNEFISSLFNLLSPTAQKKLEALAQIEHRLQSPEPLLISQNNKVTMSLINLQLLRMKHLREELDFVGEEIDQIQNELLSLKDTSLEDLEKRLTHLLSENKLHEIKVDEYGDEAMPQLVPFAALEAQLTEREALRAEAAEWRDKGKLYEGIENFDVDHIKRMVQRMKYEVDDVTQKIATKLNSRKSIT